MKKRVDQEKERDLQNNIQSLETKIKLTEDEKGKLKSYKQELITLREKKMEAVLLRSRARWVAEGEKITKYFCGLEKRNYVCKQMIRLTLNNGEEIYETKEIIKEVKMFYKSVTGELCKLARVTGPEFPHPFSPVGRCMPATGRCRAVRYKRQCLPGFCTMC